MKIQLLLTLFLIGLLKVQIQAQAPIDEELAFTEIREMLAGKQKLSFERAVYLTERAFLGEKLSEELWQLKIGALTGLARMLAESRELVYEGKDEALVSIHAAIFSVMRDTIRLMLHGELLYRPPFQYDFSDIWGLGDWSKMFVYKLLSTGSGNCHSLPYLYKILANRLGVPAWLSTAPNHLYIKNQCETYGWYNTELTSGMFPMDAWLMASGYIHLDAIKNGIYMDTLSEPESVALCLVDLAQGFQRKLGMGDGAFVLSCCSLALEHYPRCVSAMLMLAETQRKLLFSAPSAPQSGDTDQQESRTELESLYAKIHRLGYRRMPEEMYAGWLESLPADKAKFENKIIRPAQDPK